MTAIAPSKFPTKKALREAASAGSPEFAETVFENPTPWGSERLVPANMKPGDCFVCTNHPRRTWFAEVKRTHEGWKVS